MFRAFERANKGQWTEAHAHGELHQYDAAIRDYTRAIELQTDFADAYRNRGSAYLNRGLARENKPDVFAARSDYTKAHELNPRAVEPLYTKATEKNATDPAPFINRGLLYARRKQHDLAIADYDKALAAAPNLVIAHFNKTQAFDQAGHAQEAAAAYRTFLEKAGADDASLV